MNVLVAEVGGSKSDWWYIDHRLQGTNLLTTHGFHPFWQGSLLENQLLPAVVDQLNGKPVWAVHYYGTGTTGSQARQRISEALAVSFPSSNIEIQSDLLAAARALSPNQSSVVCILGTGSNSGYFDGLQFTSNVISGGILIGDEGSGAYLGKLLVRNWIYGNLTKALSEQLESYLNQGPNEYIQSLYTQVSYSTELAKLSQFINKYKQEREIAELIEANFILFIDRILKKYPIEGRLNVNFTGGIAWTYQKELSEVLEANNITLGIIAEKPIYKLIDYHINILKENNL